VRIYIPGESCTLGEWLVIGKEGNWSAQSSQNKCLRLPAWNWFL